MKITRRQILGGAALAAATGVAGRLRAQVSALTGVATGPNGERGTLVFVFLRGGADGLNIVVPWADANYHRLRPSLALSGPRDGGDRSARVLDLDGFFGFHPALGAALPLYRQGRLAAVHAVGSQDRSRSHFEAMSTVERGSATAAGASGGWLARLLAATGAPDDPPLRAVAFTDTLPQSLSGAPNATVLSSPADYHLIAPAPLGDRAASLARSLSGFYGVQQGTGAQAAVSRAGRETLAAMDAIARADAAHYRPERGATYPDADIGIGLRQTACLVKAGVGLEVACLDMGGWDTHVGQGRDTGLMPARLRDLARSLEAFATDLGPLLARVTVVAATEFGRRAYENSGLGTDHGRAGCMLVVGGGVAGGKVHGAWPGLAPSQLEEPGDLRVTTDYRDVLAEVVAAGFGIRALDPVFPGYAPRPLGVVRSG